MKLTGLAYRAMQTDVFALLVEGFSVEFVLFFSQMRSLLVDLQLNSP